MRVVLVSSPGRATQSHWSHALTNELAHELLAAGAEVELFQVTGPHQPPAPAPPGAMAQLCVRPRAITVSGVAASLLHAELEHDLAHSLRRRHAAAVVHVGAGAGGSPNVLWLAERMGSRVFAVVRGAEVVCHRGDLIDAGGEACRRHDDAARCRSCCRGSWWSRPHASDFENRWDLVVGGLLVAGAVFVDEPLAAEHLHALGIASGQLVVGHAALAIARQVLAAG